MRSGRIFWGVALVSLGLLVLAHKAGIMTPKWSIALGLWPLVLVLWGVGLLVGGKVVRFVTAGVAGIVLAYFLAALFTMSFWDDEEEGEMAKASQSFVVSPDTAVKRAKFVLDSGAGAFTIADTSMNILQAEVESNIGMYAFDEGGQKDDRTYTMSLEGKRKGIRMGRTTNQVTAHLNSAPIWDLEMNIGAAKLTCDLTPFKVEHLEINGGASSMKITLGDRSPTTNVHVSAGASSITVYVPESAACEVQLETALSSKHFPGFTKSGEGMYRTENFSNAKSTISVNIEAGVSSIRVERY
jgi:hypothetical protein